MEREPASSSKDATPSAPENVVSESNLVSKSATSKSANAILVNPRQRLQKARKYDFGKELSLMYGGAIIILIPIDLTWDGLVTKYFEKYIKMMGIAKKIQSYIHTIALKRTFKSVMIDDRSQKEEIDILDLQDLLEQKGNPLLKHIGKVPWEFDERIVPDYVMGRTTCALFLSIKYHALKPDYIADRIKALGKLYELRVLLVLVDNKDPHHSLKYLTRVCLICDLTLMLAWSSEEAGQMIETYKVFENKPPDMIMEKQDMDPHAKLVSALTSVRSINKTDATTLLSTFGSLEAIVKATKDSLSLCPGIGPSKAARLHNILHQPFLISDNFLSEPPPKKKLKESENEEKTDGIVKYLKKQDAS